MHAFLLLLFGEFSPSLDWLFSVGKGMRVSEFRVWEGEGGPGERLWEA